MKYFLTLISILLIIGSQKLYSQTSASSKSVPDEATGEQAVTAPVFMVTCGNFPDGGRVLIASAPSVQVENSETISDEEVTAQAPVIFHLGNCYPNPFNPATTIEYGIPNDGNVSLRVYDLLGRVVATLVEGYQQAGNKTISFDGSQLPSGIYYYRFQAGAQSDVKKMLLLK